MALHSALGTESVNVFVLVICFCPLQSLAAIRYLHLNLNSFLITLLAYFTYHSSTAGAMMMGRCFVVYTAICTFKIKPLLVGKKKKLYWYFLMGYKQTF